MNKKPAITGIHHITALGSGASGNLAFYAGVLGLRLIKKTVNFDDPDVYHLYYGDEPGNPGTLITFFPYEGMRSGHHGRGQVNTTAFSVPMASIGFWEERFKRFHVHFKHAQERMGQEVFIYFEDMDGLGLELVFNDRDKRPGYVGGAVPSAYAIKGIYSAEIWSGGYERTAGLLTEQMHHRLIREQGNRFRFAALDEPGNYIDILVPADLQGGQSGAGTIHHIAFSTPDEQSQLSVRNDIVARGLKPTPVVDRQYFKSVYFREPAGVLFEIATAGPGFTIDESLGSLGERLCLPPRYEAFRSQIENGLSPLDVNISQYA